MSISTQSLWASKRPRLRFDADLPETSTADVCILGAGVAGLTTAYRALLEGLDVVVLDDGAPGDGETGRSTAHLSSALDEHFVHLERIHGIEGSRLAAESHSFAIDAIDAIVRDEGIDCDFRRVAGYLLGTRGDAAAYLALELEAARRAGLEAVYLDRSPLPGFDVPAIRFARQGELDPLAYVDGLARAVSRLGGVIHEGVRVDRVTPIDGDDAHARVITSDDRTVVARHVVVATNAPITSQVTIPLRQSAYRSYVVAFEMPAGSVDPALYWDTDDPYHYVRVATDRTNARTLLVVGGEDQKTGQDREPEKRFDAIERWARSHMPFLGKAVAKWSGQIMEPADGLAFLGRQPGSKNVYVITGDSGHGLTHATIGAFLVMDQIHGRANRWEALYSPGRSSLRGAGKLLRENVNVALQYTDRVRRGDLPDASMLERDSGAIVREDGKLVAVHRDEHGALHRFSGLCPHLGGVLHWNGVERSWDCPCHGSRFDADGRLLDGPATSDLVSLPSAVPPRTIAR